MTIPTGNIASIGVGVCAAHPTPKSIVVIFTPGAPTVMTGGMPTLNLVATGIASCGHPTIPASVSAKVMAEKTGVHRMGDTGIVTGGVYIVSSADPTVLSG